MLVSKLTSCGVGALNFRLSQRLHPPQVNSPRLSNKIDLTLQHLALG
jgi:hypothetical protein